MNVELKKIAGSDKSAHQSASMAGKEIGEVWREQVNVVVSKLTEPRRTATKWRWFAKATGSAKTIGRGTRAALLIGAGFKTKDEAISALIAALETNAV